jgi:hypothetical protein
MKRYERPGMYSMPMAEVKWLVQSPSAERWLRIALQWALRASATPRARKARGRS